MVKLPRRWSEKFRDAFRGIVLGVRGQSSFRVHIPIALAVLAAAGALKCNRVEWCLLLGCIGLVLTAELFNSAVETLFHALDDTVKERMEGCLDMAAGAVLLASITSAVVGLLVFVPRIMEWWK